MHFLRWTFSCAFLAALPTAPSLLAGENSSIPASSSTGSGLVSDLLAQIVRDQLKTEYVDDDDWGKTRRVTVGYRVRGKPFEWRLQRQTREVNDGLWEKYAVRLVDPEEHLQFQVLRLEMHGGQLQFQVSVTANLACDARVERWRQGVKMLNAHVEATGAIRIQLSGSIGIRMVADGGIPGVALEPAIADIDLKLLKFNLKRISKLEGKAARELGDSLHDTIQKELNRREAKIVAKLNRSIEKRADKLRLSPAEFARTGWAKLQEAVN